MKGWRAPNIWRGSACYIIGGGPSWLQQFKIPKQVIDKVRVNKEPISIYSPYLEFLHGKHVIGVNGAFQLGSWISVCAFMDLLWFEEHEAKLLKEFSGLRVTTNEPLMEKTYIRGKKHIQYFAPERNKIHGISELEGQCAQNGNSGAFAINVAYHLGAKRIYLFGFDMNLTNGASHFHGEYTDPWTDTIINTHLRCFPEIARDAKQLGIQIFNVNPDSQITCFPKITLDEVIRSEEK